LRPFDILRAVSTVERLETGRGSGALDPALRGGAPYGAEPGVIIKPDSTAKE